MPVHFAAARSTAHSPIARALARKALVRAANDNEGNDDAPQSVGGTVDRVMRAALLHFAQHGLGAAQEARQQAEQAHHAGDNQSYEWWLGVCRTLDRHVAAQLARRLSGDLLIH